MHEGKGEGIRGWRGLLAYVALLIALSSFTMTLGSSLRDCSAGSRTAALCSPLIWSYDIWSATLLTDSVAREAAVGDRDVGGFMTATEPTVHIAAVELIDGAKGARQNYPYISNFGLQYVLAKHSPRTNPQRMSPVFSWFSLMCGLGMALVVAGMTQFAARRFGRLSGMGVILIFGLSPMMILHALNPYWMIFLSFLPFMAMLMLYPKAQSTGKFCAVAALAGALVGLKALTGYEYVSTIALGAALPIIFYELEASGQSAAETNRAMLRRIVQRSVIVGLFAVLGFAVAAALHVYKATLLFGSLDKGMMAFTLPMSYSAFESGTGIRGNVVVSVPSMILTVLQNLLLRNQLVTLPLYAALLATGMLMMRRCGGSWRQLWSQLDQVHRALVWTWLISIPAGLSWVALAARHSVAHTHINWVLSYMFTHVFAAMLVGRNVAALRTTLAETEAARVQAEA